MAAIIDISEALLKLGLSSTVTDEERAIVNTAIVSATGAIRRYLRYDPTTGTRTEFYPQYDSSVNSRDLAWEISGGRAVMSTSQNASRRELQLRGLPIRSVTSVYETEDARAGTASGAFGAEDLLTVGDDYWPAYDGVDSSGVSFSRSGILHSLSGWATTPGSIKVVYVSGYSNAELRGQDASLDASPIWEATMDEVVRRVLKDFEVRKKSGQVGWTAGQIQSENLGDYSYTLGGTSGSGSAGDRRTGGVYDLLPETTQKLSEFVNFGIAMGG